LGRKNSREKISVEVCAELAGFGVRDPDEGRAPGGAHDLRTEQLKTCPVGREHEQGIDRTAIGWGFKSRDIERETAGRPR
jgi:hypothetical protein